MIQHLLKTIVLLTTICSASFAQLTNEQLEAGTASNQFLMSAPSSPFYRDYVDASTIDISIFNNDAGFITGNQTITLSGDVTGSGATSITTDIASGVVGSTELLDDGVKLVDIDYIDIFTNATQDNTLTTSNYVLFGEDATATGGIKKTRIGDFQTYMQNNMSNVLPAGGTSGQVLTKDTGTDYDVSWQTPAGPLYNVSSTSSNITDLYSDHSNYDYVRMSSVSTITATVETTTEGVGSTITLEQTGAGAVRIQAGTGVTLNGVSLQTSNQYQILQVIKVASGVFSVIGG